MATSTPGNGLPIVPGFRLPGVFSVTTGAASVWPYPSKIGTLNRFSNASAIAIGQRLAAGNRKSHGRDIEIAFRRRKHAIHRRNRQKHADPVFLDQLQDFRRLESIHQNHLAAVQQRQQNVPVIA